MQSHLKNIPLVSVLIPCYNHASFVQRAIRSVVEQTYSEIELIVIDDGSSDCSVQKIYELEALCRKRFVSFKFKARANKGVGPTLNELMDLSRGSYLALLASDDYWVSTKIERQVSFMIRNASVVLCFTEFFAVDETGLASTVGHYKVAEKKFLTFDDIIQNPDFPPASTMWRASELKRVNFSYHNDRVMIEDLYSWLFVLSYGGVAAVVKEKLSFYRMHSQNSSADKQFIADGHWAVVTHFKGKIKNWRSVKASWALRNANYLAREHKLRSFKYLCRGIFRVWDIRLYKAIFKIVFK